MSTFIIAEDLSLQEAVELLEEKMGCSLKHYAELFAKDPAGTRYRVQCTCMGKRGNRYKIVI